MGTYMTGNPRISGHRVPSRLDVCGRCGHCPQSTMSTASFYDLQSDAIQVVLHVFIQKGGGGRSLPYFQKKERFCGVTKNVSPKIFEIDPHHADKNLQADVFNRGWGCPLLCIFW